MEDYDTLFKNSINTFMDISKLKEDDEVHQLKKDNIDELSLNNLQKKTKLSKEEKLEKIVNSNLLKLPTPDDSENSEDGLEWEKLIEKRYEKFSESIDEEFEKKIMINEKNINLKFSSTNQSDSSNDEMEFNNNTKNEDELLNNNKILSNTDDELITQYPTPTESDNDNDDIEESDENNSYKLKKNKQVKSPTTFISKEQDIPSGSNDSLQHKDEHNKVDKVELKRSNNIHLNNFLESIINRSFDQYNEKNNTSEDFKNDEYDEYIKNVKIHTNNYNCMSLSHSLTPFIEILKKEEQDNIQFDPCLPDQQKFMLITTFGPGDDFDIQCERVGFYCWGNFKSLEKCQNQISKIRECNPISSFITIHSCQLDLPIIIPPPKGKHRKSFQKIIESDSNHNFSGQNTNRNDISNFKNNFENGGNNLSLKLLNDINESNSYKFLENPCLPESQKFIILVFLNQDVMNNINDNCYRFQCWGIFKTINECQEQIKKIRKHNLNIKNNIYTKLNIHIMQLGLPIELPIIESDYYFDKHINNIMNNYKNNIINENDDIEKEIQSVRETVRIENLKNGSNIFFSSLNSIIDSSNE